MGEANAPKGKLCLSALVAMRPEAPEVPEEGDSDLLPGGNNTKGVMAFCADKWCNRDVQGERGKGFAVFFKCRSP